MLWFTSKLVILFIDWKHRITATLYSAIMYFYNVFFIIFPFPKSKIYLRIHPLCLTLAPGRGRGGMWASPQSGRAEEVGTPTVWPLPTHCCWWVAGGEHPILGADFLFIFSWGHSAGWPRSSFSSAHLVCLVLIPRPTQTSISWPKILLQ